MLQLGPTPQAAGADNAARSQFAKSSTIAGYENIDRVFSFGDCADTQSPRDVSRHILHAVYGDIDAPGKQCRFDFFHEKTFAAHFGEGHIQNFIPLGFYNNKLDRG